LGDQPWYNFRLPSYAAASRIELALVAEVRVIGIDQLDPVGFSQQVRPDVVYNPDIGMVRYGRMPGT